MRGFVQIPLMLMMASLLALGACAGPGTASRTTTSDTPLQTTGKSLLAVKSTIVTAATTVDRLCKAGTLKPDTCAEAKVAYDQARVAYDSAVDTYLLTTQGYGDPAALDSAITKLQAIALNLLTLADPNAPQGGAK